jgi:hypothetical protein
MPMNRYKPEQIVTMLRQIEVVSFAWCRFRRYPVPDSRPVMSIKTSVISGPTLAST